MKKLVFIVLVFIMFFFKNFASANYNKVFYDLQINSISGELIDFKKYKGKAILVVNTASYCGFTKQYEGLQKLWEKYESKGLIVLGIPSDTFNQEKAHEIFKWAKENHGKSAVPKWNFYKILINTDGKVEDTFSSLTKPMSQKIIQKIEETLKIY